LEGFEFAANLLAQVRIERGERLVEEEDFGVEDETSSEGDALFFTAAEFRRFSFGLAADLQHLQDGRDAPSRVVKLRGRQVAEAELDVVADGEVGEEGVVLKDGADAAFEGPESGEGAAVEEDVAARGDFEAGDEAEGGGLAATGGAEEGEELAFADGEREVVDGGVAGKFLAESSQFEGVVH
jgi:hypothetical protein